MKVNSVPFIKKWIESRTHCESGLWHVPMYSNTTHGMKSRCKLFCEMLFSALKKANSIHPSGFAESLTKNSGSSLPKPKTFQQEKCQLWIEILQKLKPSRHASKSDEIIITTLPTEKVSCIKTSFCGGLKCVIQRGIIFPRYTALPMYATLHVYSMYAVHANFIESYTHKSSHKKTRHDFLVFIESYAVYMPVPKTSVQKNTPQHALFWVASLNKHTAVTKSIWWWNPTVNPTSWRDQNSKLVSKLYTSFNMSLFSDLHYSAMPSQKPSPYFFPTSKKIRTC